MNHAGDGLAGPAAQRVAGSPLQLRVLRFNKGKFSVAVDRSGLPATGCSPPVVSRTLRLRNPDLQIDLTISGIIDFLGTQMAKFRSLRSRSAQPNRSLPDPMPPPLPEQPSLQARAPPVGAWPPQAKQKPCGGHGEKTEPALA